MKRAYRKRAKQLHPDRNKDVNAHDQFVLLNEANDYLLHVKESGNSAQNADSNYYWSEQEWQAQQRENAKMRARAYAKMRYEEYIKSDYYKEQVIIDVVLAHFGILISIVLLVVFPIVAVALGGASAWGPILVVSLLLIPFHLQSYGNLRRANISTLKKSLLSLVKFKGFQLVILTTLNIIVFAKIGFHTLISPLYLLSAVVILAIIFYFKFKDKLMYYGIAPAIVSLFLLLNFVFASDGSTEKYNLQPSYSNGRDNTMIYLEDNIYSEYIGIRVFSDYTEVRKADRIIYYFNDGLFGFKVLDDYKLLSGSFSTDDDSDDSY